MTQTASNIIEVNSQQMQELLDRAASNTLREADTDLIRQIFDSYVQVFQIVGDKNTTIARLRKMLFGSSTEKSDKVLDDAATRKNRVPPRATSPRAVISARRTTARRRTTNLRQAMAATARTTISARSR